MARRGVRAAPSAPPAQALPVVLAYLSGDLASLLAAACVSRDWREALSRMPEVWQAVHFPKRTASKVTDQGLRWVLRQSGERGVTSLDLGGCAQLTDRVVPDIVEALKRVPEKVSLRGCRGMTWRGARTILQHLQNRYEQAGQAGAGELERGRSCLRSVRIVGVSLEGCGPAALAQLTRLPVLGGQLDWMALCEGCEEPRLLQKCEWCGERGCPAEDLENGDMLTCGRCQNFGCGEHFLEYSFSHCNCVICNDCLDEHPDRATPCYKCDTILCPVCDSDVRNTLRECEGPTCFPPNTVCDACRLEDCICKCKDDEMTVEDLRRRKYPVLCEECVRTQERVLDDYPFSDKSSTRYCSDCGLLRRCRPDLDTDDESQEDCFDDSDDSTDSQNTEGLDDSDDYDSWFDDLGPRRKRGEGCSSDEESDGDSGAVDGPSVADDGGEESDEDVSGDDDDDQDDELEDEDDMDDDENEDGDEDEDDEDDDEDDDDDVSDDEY